MEHRKVSPLLQKEIAKTTNTTIQKIRENVTFIVLAVVIATAFFIHESVPLMPDEVNQAEAKWKSVKSENTVALNKLKQLNFDFSEGKISLEEFVAQQPVLVNAYKKVNQEKNQLHKILKSNESKAQVLQFRSLHYFLGELGWALGLLLYALANLLNSFYLKKRYMKREFTGKFLFHSTLLFIGCFYTFYVFYSEDDFSRGWYIMAMALSTVALIFASKFIVDTYIKRSAYLKENINNLIAFIFRIRTKHYRKVAVKALYAEEKDVVIDRIETVQDNTNEFDEDFYTTLKKIDL